MNFLIYEENFIFFFIGAAVNALIKHQKMMKKDSLLSVERKFSFTAISISQECILLFDERKINSL